MAKVDIGRVSIVLDSGTETLITVQSQKFSDRDVSFSKTFNSIPLILTAFVSNSESYRYGSLSVSILKRQKTGFTLRVFNNSDIQLSPTINWCAIERT